MDNENINRGDENENRNYKVHDGYSYTVSKTTRDGTKYLVCKGKTSIFCKGSARVKPDGVVKIMHEHCHARDEFAEELFMLRRELKRAVITQGGFLKDIYDTTILLYPNAGIKLPYIMIEPSMRRWRTSVLPPMPNSLLRWGTILQDDSWKRLITHSGGAMTAHIARAENEEDESSSVVIGDRQFIDSLRADAPIFIDATFKTVPRDVGGYQLLTIMSLQHNHAIPIVWALMSRKTALAYRQVFNVIKAELAPHLMPTSVMSDFERGLRNEAAAAFPDARVIGCYFHYCQALQKQAKKQGILRAIRNNNEGYELLKNYMALALLPVDKIQETAREIYVEAGPEIRQIFSRFNLYFKRQWLQRETPQSFSVYGEIKRTNNCVESFNSKLLSKLGPRPNIWQFTRKMTELQAATQLDLAVLRTGRPVTRTPKLRYIINDTRIRRAWRQFETNDITARELLEVARNEVDQVQKNIEYRMDQDEAAGVNLDVNDDDEEDEIDEGYQPREGNGDAREAIPMQLDEEIQAEQPEDRAQVETGHERIEPEIGEDIQPEQPEAGAGAENDHEWIEAGTVEEIAVLQGDQKNHFPIAVVLEKGAANRQQNDGIAMSRSRKKNLAKKRRRQQKSQDQNEQPQMFNNKIRRLNT